MLKNDGYINKHSTTILVCPELTFVVTQEFFLPAYWQQRGKVRVAPGGRGTTWFIQWDEQDWVLRHYHRGGAMAKLFTDRYCYLGVKSTRAWQEWHLLRSLVQMQLPVPKPIACHIKRHGCYYRADLITEKIPDVMPLSMILQQKELSKDVWVAIGKTIRCFHDHRVYHADLNAHNILVGVSEKNQGQVWIIDFDKCKLRKAGVGWQQRNLQRLSRSLTKLQKQRTPFYFNEGCFKSLLNGYAG